MSVFFECAWFPGCPEPEASPVLFPSLVRHIYIDPSSPVYIDPLSPCVRRLEQDVNSQSKTSTRGPRETDRKLVSSQPLRSQSRKVTIGPIDFQPNYYFTDRGQSPLRKTTPYPPARARPRKQRGVVSRRFSVLWTSAKGLVKPTSARVDHFL